MKGRILASILSNHRVYESNLLHCTKSTDFRSEDIPIMPILKLPRTYLDDHYEMAELTHNHTYQFA